MHHVFTDMERFGHSPIESSPFVSALTHDLPIKLYLYIYILTNLTVNFPFSNFEEAT